MDPLAVQKSVGAGTNRSCYCQQSSKQKQDCEYDGVDTIETTGGTNRSSVGFGDSLSGRGGWLVGEVNFLPVGPRFQMPICSVSATVEVRPSSAKHSFFERGDLRLAPNPV